MTKTFMLPDAMKSSHLLSIFCEENLYFCLYIGDLNKTVTILLGKDVFISKQYEFLGI